MEKINITVEMFGKKVKYDYDFYAKSAIKTMDSLKEAITKPQYFGNSGYDVILICGYEYDHDKNVSSDTIVEYALRKIGFDGDYSAQAILMYSDEDEDETKRINAGYTGIFGHCATFGAELQAAIAEEATRVQKVLREEIDSALDAIAKKKADAAAAKEALLAGVEWKTEEKTISDEGGKTKMYIHTLTINGKQYIITERNVFDFGRVLNADRGGMYTKQSGVWCLSALTNGGWEEHEIPEDEQKAADIISKYGAFAGCGVRM